MAAKLSRIWALISSNPHCDVQVTLSGFYVSPVRQIKYLHYQHIEFYSISRRYDLDVFSKLRKTFLARDVCPSVSMETTRLPLWGFWSNSIFEYYTNICRETSSSITIWQEKRVLSAKTSFSQNEKCSTQICRENQNTHFMFNIPPRNFAVVEVVWKNIVQPERPQVT